MQTTLTKAHQKIEESIVYEGLQNRVVRAAKYRNVKLRSPDTSHRKMADGPTTAIGLQRGLRTHIAAVQQALVKDTHSVNRHQEHQLLVESSNIAFL